MRQEQFEARFEADWASFEHWLRWAQQPTYRRRKLPPPFAVAEAPVRYRTLCQHLALARSRDYGPAVVERLHRLALEGHDILYGTPGGWAGAWFRWLSGGFAREVRSHWRSVLLASLLLYLPALLLALAVRHWPDFAQVVLPQETLDKFGEMYGPAAHVRTASSDVAAFGGYVYNNISVGFRTFATGITAGLGSLFFLIYNGVLFGVVEAHVVNLGYAQRFHTFVVAHGSFELTAITFFGAAGLELGWALLAPGPYSRGAALRRAGQGSISMVAGAAAMLVIAAAIEAFWSPRVWPAGFKYGSGAVCWLLVLAYFLLAGHRRESR